jgi:hypothetical protein
MASRRIIYTRHAEEMLAERNIARAWVEATIAAPEIVIPDPKRPTVHRAYRRITEHGGRYLLVAYVQGPDSVRVVTVFFDRRYRPK